MIRVYKIRAFTRFQRKERISDGALVKAIRDAGDGLVDAELGGDLIKQRIARPGQGKSGGYRTILAFRRGSRAVFLYGFAKSERSNIDDDELEEFKRLAQFYFGLNAAQIAALVADNGLTEVIDDKSDESKD